MFLLGEDQEVARTLRRIVRGGGIRPVSAARRDKKRRGRRQKKRNPRNLEAFLNRVSGNSCDQPAGGDFWGETAASAHEWATVFDNEVAAALAHDVVEDAAARAAAGAEGASDGRAAALVVEDAAARAARGTEGASDGRAAAAHQPERARCADGGESPIDFVERAAAKMRAAMASVGIVAPLPTPPTKPNDSPLTWDFPEIMTEQEAQRVVEETDWCTAFLTDLNCEFGV